jgi:outer membrane biosynthesis protein TonB
MRLLVLAFLFAAGSVFALGRSAEDYFHGAAYKYLAGRHQEAAVEVEEGLREHPGDPKLQMLSDVLKQMKDQQRQDQNQSGGGDSKQNPKDKKDQKDQKDGKDPNKDSQNQGKDDQKKDSQDKKQDSKDKQNQDKDSNKDKNQQPQPKPEDKQGQQPKDSSGQGGQARRMPGQMSKDEAERLLNSFIDEEKKAHQDKQGKPAEGGQPEQDW